MMSSHRAKASKYKAESQLTNGYRNRPRGPDGPHNYYNDGYDETDEELTKEQRKQLQQQHKEEKRTKVFSAFVTSETRADPNEAKPKKKKIFKAAVYDDDSPPIGHDYIERQKELNMHLPKQNGGSGQPTANGNRERPSPYSERGVDVDRDAPVSSRNNNYASVPDGNKHSQPDPEPPVKRTNNEDLFSSITANYRGNSLRRSLGGLHPESKIAKEDSAQAGKEDLYDTLNSSGASLHSLQSRCNIDPLNISTASVSSQKDKKNKKKSNHAREDSFTKPLVDNELEAGESAPPQPDSDQEPNSNEKGSVHRERKRHRDGHGSQSRNSSRTREREHSNTRDHSRTRDGSQTRDQSNSRSRHADGLGHQSKEKHKRPEDFPLPPIAKLEPIPKLDLSSTRDEGPPPRLEPLQKLDNLPKLDPIPKLNITARSDKDDLGSTTRSAFDGEDTKRKLDELLNPFKKDMASKYEVDEEKVKERERKHKHKSHHHHKEHKEHDRHHHGKDDKKSDRHHRREDKERHRKDDKDHNHHREHRHKHTSDKESKSADGDSHHHRSHRHKSGSNSDDSHRKDSSHRNGDGDNRNGKEKDTAVPGTPKSGHRERCRSVSGPKERKSSVSSDSKGDKDQQKPRRDSRGSSSDHDTLNETVIPANKDKTSEMGREGNRGRPSSAKTTTDRPSSAKNRGDRTRPSSAGRSRARSSSTSRNSDERDSSRERKTDREHKARDRSLDRAISKARSGENDTPKSKPEKSGWTGDLIKDYTFAINELEKSFEDPPVSKKDSGRKPNPGKPVDDLVLEDLISPRASMDFLEPPNAPRPDVVNTNPAGTNKLQSHSIRIDLGLDGGESIEI